MEIQKSSPTELRLTGARLSHLRVGMTVRFDRGPQRGQRYVITGTDGDDLLAVPEREAPKPTRTRGPNRRERRASKAIERRKR